MNTIVQLIAVSSWSVLILLKFAKYNDILPSELPSNEWISICPSIQTTNKWVERIWGRPVNTNSKSAKWLCSCEQAHKVSDTPQPLVKCHYCHRLTRQDINNATSSKTYRCFKTLLLAFFVPACYRIVRVGSSVGPLAQNGLINYLCFFDFIYSIEGSGCVPACRFVSGGLSLVVNVCALYTGCCGEVCGSQSVS